LIDSCLVRPGKRYYYLHYDERAMRVAKRRVIEKKSEFKDRYRWRAGTEATISEFDRRTGVKRLRVRGFKAVRFSATLKAVGINLFRAAAVRKAANYDNAASSKVKSTLNHAIFFVKEHFMRIFGPLKNYFELHSNCIEHKLITNI
jgi:Transposase DDE domain